jgi:hypothetical protein
VKSCQISSWLPHLVGQTGFETDVGRFRTLLRLRDDLPVSGQDPPHRGHRHDDLVVLVQVPADGVRAGVEALLGELLAQPQHALDDLGAGRGR